LSAALIRGGELVAAAEEERFRRQTLGRLKRILVDLGNAYGVRSMALRDFNAARRRPRTATAQSDFG
jgi:hypothetical protein